jgi:hypothetical protein
VHGRTGTPVDVAIDAIGMAIAAWLISRQFSPGYRGRRDAVAQSPRSSPARWP